MSVSGLCGICETAEATHRCDRCGNVVCDDHFDATTGYCTDCMRQLGEKPDRDDVFKM